MIVIEESKEKKNRRTVGKRRIRTSSFLHGWLLFAAAEIEVVVVVDYTSTSL